jgi:hypothetical protein
LGNRLGKSYSKISMGIRSGLFGFTKSMQNFKIQNMRLKMAVAAVNRPLNAKEAAIIRALGGKAAGGKMNSFDFDIKIGKAGASLQERRVLLKVFEEDLDDSGLIALFNRGAS